MAYTSLGRMTIRSSGPTITADIAYERQRSGSSMQYRFKVILNGLLYSDSYFGYNLKADVKLDNVSKKTGAPIKDTSPSQWTSDRPAVYLPSSSEWYTVSNKNSGTTSLSLRIYSDNGGGTDSTYTKSLTVDPGKSTISSSLELTINTSNTITVSRKDSSFSHTITYKFGSASGTIGSSKTTSTSISWTPPLALYAQMPGKSSATGTITIETFDGTSSTAKSLGSNSYTLTLKASAVYNTPSISGFGYERGTYSNGAWTPSNNGSDVRIAFTAAVSRISGNTTTATLMVGTAHVYSGSLSSGTVVKYKTGIGTITSYPVVLTVSDTIGSSRTFTLAIPTLEVPFNMNFDLPGAAFGKIAELAKVLQLAAGWDLDIGGDIGFEGGEQTGERHIHFKNTNGANPHNCQVYGGNPGSATGIGLWDTQNARRILSYTDYNNRLYIGSDDNASDTRILGSLTLGGHSTPVGSVISATSTTKSVSSYVSGSSTITNLTSLSIPAGVWVIIGGIYTGSVASSSAGGVVRITLGDTSTSDALNPANNNGYGSNSMRVYGSTTAVYTEAVTIRTGGATTVYLNVLQNTGSTLSITGQIRAVRIA